MLPRRSNITYYQLCSTDVKSLLEDLTVGL